MNGSTIGIRYLNLIILIVNLKNLQNLNTVVDETFVTDEERKTLN